MARITRTSLSVVAGVIFSLNGALSFSISPNGGVTVSRSFRERTTRLTALDNGGSMIPGVSEDIDLNQYNLEYENAIEEWTANALAKSPVREAGIYLGARDSTNNFVDTLKFEVSRDGGLGIELVEIAGGRGDGVGITICSGLVAGGNAASTGIIPGDSVASLEVKGNDNPDAAVRTECLDYDSTIDAILSLPSDGDTLVVTVKRIRRKPKTTVVLQYPPEMNEPDVSLELFSGENLRRAMLVRGIKLNDPLSRRFDSGGSGDCGADGTCATCVVSIAQGGHLMSPPGLQEQQILVKNPRWRMACKTIIGYGAQEGKMVVKVNPRQW
mmetsp:Transcript_28835/g.44824  ORF Transcript_28835/g.44824 Transcript_28835/m.44824 type:complete len:327 (-) Transcript_28835:749-1729(-)|eukprot:CAMPEP_0196808124 /NCGR_PEP_ID=MMETSP1362-20130617/8097_1 /TAXON_ID=163516 /ORGANISM="Leptocylindrus danicus, Strain CCMP1856" /LENGTH=326 /DNA_ID=CAMNT_0042182323 /DNA_START=43 /DNA_END=1023 /DNA_ORIENTATION=+